MHLGEISDISYGDHKLALVWKHFLGLAMTVLITANALGHIIEVHYAEARMVWGVFCDNTFGGGL